MHNIRVPYKKDPSSPLCNEWEYKTVPVYWPHELLQYLFEEVGIRVCEDALQAYWSQARQNGFEWAKASADDASLKIPLKLFGDDATFNQQGYKVLGILLSCPLWRPRSARNSRWPVAAISLYGNLGYPTLQPILREITWSLNRAFDIPLPRLGLTFQITEIGGDWKYMKESLCLTTHWNSQHMCHFCKIHRNEFPKLVEPLQTRNTADFILEAVSSATPSPLILLRRFDVSMIQWCLLHTLHIGLLFTANGGALSFLLEELGMWSPPGADFRLRLRTAHAEFKAWLKRHHIPCSQRPFTVNMLYKASHGAHLSCKGWNSRIVAAWLSEVCYKAWVEAVRPDDELTLLAHAMSDTQYCEFECFKVFSGGYPSLLQVLHPTMYASYGFVSKVSASLKHILGIQNRVLGSNPSGVLFVRSEVTLCSPGNLS